MILIMKNLKLFYKYNYNIPLGLSTGSNDRKLIYKLFNGYVHFNLHKWKKQIQLQI